MNTVLPPDAKRWIASRRAISSNTLHGVTRHKHRGSANRSIHPRSLRWGLHKLREQVLKQPVAIEHRPQGQNDGQSEIRCSDGHREGTGGRSPAYQPCATTTEGFLNATKMIADGWDREQLERGEARVLASNFKNKEWLEMALKVSERIYGLGSALRIKTHMRLIWRDELCK